MHAPSPLTGPQSLWEDLSSWLTHWFHDPDLEALKICLCSLTAHYYPAERPLWLFVIGDSGSGKTEIIIQAFKDLPDARIIGTLTPKCFLSSWQKGGRENSMLLRGGPSQIWLAKDFTTFASMRPEVRAEVGARLREIADGEFVSDTGVGGTMSWEGKVTMLAVATPEFEDYWSAMRGLGERFMTVRWRAARDHKRAMDKVRRQAGREDEIRTRTRELMSEIWSSRRTDGEMPDSLSMHRLDALSEIVAILRVHVVRESDSSRSILRVPTPEFPSRISFALSQVVRTHADLMHKDQVDDEDISLAYRVAVDSIPPVRYAILSEIPPSGEISYGSLLHRSRIPRTSLQRQLEELTALGVLEPSKDTDWASRTARLTSYFSSMMLSSRLHIETAKKPILVPRRQGHRASLNPDAAMY